MEIIFLNAFIYQMLYFFCMSSVAEGCMFSQYFILALLSLLFLGVVVSSLAFTSESILIVVGERLFMAHLKNSSLNFEVWTCFV